MRIHTDRQDCIASGQCNLIAPHIFDQDDDGIVVVVSEHPRASDKDLVDEAIRVCPAQIISWTIE